MEILVLGMHRSGTSCLAGCLAQCGVYMGPNPEKNEFNELGYFEDPNIFLLDESILQSNLGSWHSPPNQLQVDRLAEVKLTMQVLSYRTYGERIGFKDPRILLLFDLWMKILPKSQLIGTFRHPMSVARSLERRNQIPLDKGLELWKYYNQKLVDLHRSRSFPLIAYDLRSSEVYIQHFATAAASLGINANFERLSAFVGPELDHHSDPNAPIPASCQALYTYLIQQADQ